MNKAVSMLLVVVSIFFMFLNIMPIKSYASTKNTTNGESQIIELKEDQLKTIDDYKEKYGSDVYGITAYILHLIQVFSIPFCFLGIIVSAIYKYVIGIRHLENFELGLASMIAFVTLGIICQVLPLIFAIVVKFGKE